MLSKPHRLDYSGDALDLASRLRAFKSRNLSRLFPLLSSLKHSKRPKSQWTREFRGNSGEKEFVVLIFVTYKGWKRRTQSGKLEDMELKAVRNDPRLLLDFLNCGHLRICPSASVRTTHAFAPSPLFPLDRHNDTTRNWHFVMDFDLEYTDRSGFTDFLPRTMSDKDALLRTVREATREGSSGFIHVGAHCHYEPSDLKTEGDTVIYTEIPHKQIGPKAAYFISSDGKRVYGKELYSCLSDDFGVRRDATLTLSLDMCNAGAFFEDVVNLAFRTTTPTIAVPRTTFFEQARSRKQLVLITSSQTGQASGSLHNPAGYQGLFGAATALMIESLKRRPSDSPTELIRYLNDVCSRRPEKHLRQSPSIASRYPIHGPLRHLPGPTAVA